MAQIKVYQQGKLASSLVGTAGVNPAGKEMVQAALGQVGSEIENQNQLNRASIGATNTMRSNAAEANQVINQAAIHTRQVGIQNANDILMSQNEFGNRAEDLQGRNLVNAVGATAGNYAYDARIRQAKINENIQKQNVLQDQTASRNALGPAVGQMAQYAATLQDQIKTGALNGKEAGDAYNTGIGDVIRGINDSLPAGMTATAKSMVMEQVSAYQVTQQKAITEYGHQQFNENLIKDTTSTTSQLADQSGVQPYTDDVGTTYAATSPQALVNTIAQINGRTQAQIVASGRAAGLKIINDTKAAATINWAKMGISNAKTDKDLDAVRMALEPDKNGRPMIEQQVPELDAKQIENLRTDLLGKEGAIRTVTERNDRHIEMLANANVTGVTGPAEADPENKALQYQARQQLSKGLEQANIDLRNNPTEAGLKRVKQYEQGLNLVNTNIKGITAQEKEEAHHQQMLAKMGETEARRAASEAKAQTREEKRQTQFEESERYNSDGARMSRAEILGMTKELSKDQKLKGTREDFDKLKSLQDKLDTATKLGYYQKGGTMDPSWTATQALLIDKLDRVNKAASKEGFLGLGRGDQSVKSDSERLKQLTLDGAHQKIHELYNPTGDRLHGLSIDEHANTQLLAKESQIRSKYPKASEAEVYNRLRAWKEQVLTPRQLVRPTGNQ